MEDEQQPQNQFSWGRWFIIMIAIFFVVRMCVPTTNVDSRTYTVHLKTAIITVEGVGDAVVVEAGEYRWTNYGATLEIKRWGRVIVVPVSNILYIEAWDPTQQPQQPQRGDF
jgi:hypothetical protein